MFQNVKVDIIYYDTSTDFELEFNLCGCCRMRLLTDKTDDQKLFLHMMARSVSRSRIIILTGKLFGDDGIINLTANAISKSIVATDNKLYGISSDDNIEIIEGSIPLVTPEGYFGGCIIESGPQSMVLLSDNKNIRKSIMNTLIHPYIEEMSAIALKEKAEEARTVSNMAIIEETNETETIEENTENYIDEISEEINDASETIQEEQPEENTADTQKDNMSFVFENNESSDEETYSKMFIEPSKVKFSKKSYYDEAYVPDAAQNFVFDSELEFRPINTTKSFDFSKIILALTIILLLLTAAVCFSLFYIPSSLGTTPKLFIEEIIKTLFGG
ncbi:MAG: hypothetical protein II201_01025 [Clostridia bacterium]|nr:hypothetical protein [Clostridia bacterium]